MKDKFTGNQNIQNILKNKMDQLSDSVNCFDRISERAFPQENQELSEDEVSVSGLEIISGKSHRKSVFLKAAALTAAAVLCIVFIPQTGAIQRIMTDIVNKTEKAPDDVLLEISEEINNGSYKALDVPLDYYIRNDVLVTPLFSCPFGESDDELNVRLYIRQHEGFDTNQTYAFAYSGDFTEENIVAAALPRYTFSDEELSSLQSIDTDMLHYAPMAEAVGSNFSINSADSYSDDNGKSVSIASFEKPMYYKDNSGITIINTSIIYGHNTDIDTDSYFYDMLTFDSSGNEFELPDRSSVWKKLIFAADTDLSAQENQSMFTTRTLFFVDYKLIEESLPIYISQHYDINDADVNTDQKYDPNNNIIQLDDGYDTILNSVLSPYDPTDRKLTALYIPALSYKTLIRKGNSLFLTDGSRRAMGRYPCNDEALTRDDDYSSLREETIKNMFELLEKEEKLRYEEFEKEADSKFINEKS